MKQEIYKLLYDKDLEYLNLKIQALSTICNYKVHGELLFLNNKFIQLMKGKPIFKAPLLLGDIPIDAIKYSSNCSNIYININITKYLDKCNSNLEISKNLILNTIIIVRTKNNQSEKATIFQVFTNESNYFGFRANRESMASLFGYYENITQLISVAIELNYDVFYIPEANL